MGKLKDLNKKLFKADRSLNSRSIKYSFSEIKINEEFYPVNKKELVEIWNKDNRTSKYIIPNENIPDVILFEKLMKNLHAVVKFITGKSLRVNFLEEKKQQTINNESISISLGSMYDFNIPFHARLDVLTAMGIHEAFHIKYTLPEIEKLLMDSGFTKEKISSFGFGKTRIPDYGGISKLYKNNFHQILFSILEDKRIEFLGLKDYPGYVFYLEELRKYVIWNLINLLSNPSYITKEFGGENGIYNALMKYIMFKTLLPELLPILDKIIPQTEKYLDLKNQVDIILAKNNKTASDCIVHAKELMELFPEDQQKRLSKKMGGDEENSATNNPIDSVAFKETPINGESVKINKEILENIKQIESKSRGEAQEERKPIDVSKMTSEFSKFNEIRIVPASHSHFIKDVYDKAIIIARSIQKNLAFLESRFSRAIEAFEMRQGELDQEVIATIGFNKDIFFEEEDMPTWGLDFGILIDESGSMMGRKINEARIAALAMALALKDQKHVNLFVYGHTADCDGVPVLMYRYFDPYVKKCQDINTMFSIKARNNNADGFAIEEMANIMSKSKNKQKVLVVCSDGQPSAWGYSGKAAIDHVASVVKKLEKQGIYVIQVALDDMHSEKMFTHYIPYDGKTLGLNLKKILNKKLTEISNLI